MSYARQLHRIALEINGWEHAPISPDWQISRDGDVPTLSLHGCEPQPASGIAHLGWKLPKKHRSMLHADLSKLFGELDGVLELTATWSSDGVDQFVDLSRADVLERVLTNRIANGTAYTIT